MKVLLLNGSPHADGCTAAALRELAATLEQEGVETQLVQVGDRPVRGCISCGGCQGTRHRCVLKDYDASGEVDLVNCLLEKMEQSDGLVIGSPVYYASPNGTLLSLLDRLFYAGDCFQYKPGCVVVSARRAGTTATYDVLNKYLGISGMLQVPSCYWNMVHGTNRNEVVQDEEGMRNMRVLGKNMAWLLKSLVVARERVPYPSPEPPKRTNFIR